MNTLIKILENVPELVAPYSIFLTTNGNHDPKMTSYWFGTTLLINKIINLNIPHFMETVDSNVPPSTSLVIENILPSLLTKSSLTKSLQYETSIIRQLACQLIVLAFKKLEKVSTLYDKKGWKNEKAVLLNKFHTRIPELPIFVSTLNNALATNKDNKILPLSISVIFNYYSKLFPNLFSINLPPSTFIQISCKNLQFLGWNLLFWTTTYNFKNLTPLKPNGGTQIRTEILYSLYY